MLWDQHHKRVVEEKRRANGVPIDCTYHVLAESSRKGARRVIRIAVVASTFWQFAAIYDFQANAAEGLFDQFPFLVHCETNGVNHVYYLSKIGSDGLAVYVSPERLAGTITVGGKAEPVGGSGAGSCSGKTLEQLRAAGKHMICKTEVC